MSLRFTRSTLLSTAAVFVTGFLALTSVAQAGLSDRYWNEALIQTSGCETAFNETMSEGVRCLFGLGQNLVFGEGARLANEYGKRTFGDHFQLIGNLAYSRFAGRSGFGGDLDAVIPLADGEPTPGAQGTRSALFLQQGITRWWDSSSSLHNDLRHGLVYRFRVSDELDADILGISMFHLIAAEQQHKVLVPVIDYTGRWGTGSFRYFSPTTGWRATLPGHEARALEGMELAMGVNVTSTLHLNTTGYRWETEDGSGRWTSGVRVGVGWRPHPWLKLSAGYDRMEEGDVALSFLARLTIPLGSQSESPRWEGLGIADDESALSNQDLWRPIEAIGQIKVAVRTTAASLVSSAEVRFLQDTVDSGGAVQLEVVLPAVAPEDIRVSVRLVPGSEDTPAVPGEDYVDEPVETTIAQGATTGRVSIQLLRNDDMRGNRSLSATVLLVP